MLEILTLASEDDSWANMLTGAKAGLRRSKTKHAVSFGAARPPAQARLALHYEVCSMVKNKFENEAIGLAPQSLMGQERNSVDC